MHRGGVGYASTAIPTDATTVTMHPLPLGKNWQGTLRYGLNDGVVCLNGTASKSTGPYTCMTTLPKAARPGSKQLDIALMTPSTPSLFSLAQRRRAIRIVLADRGDYLIGSPHVRLDEQA